MAGAGHAHPGRHRAQSVRATTWTLTHVPKRSRDFEYHTKAGAHTVAIRAGVADQWDVWWDDRVWITYAGNSPDMALDALTTVEHAFPEGVRAFGNSMTLSLPENLRNWSKVKARKESSGPSDVGPSGP
jgi:hypothetical protein